MTDSVFTVALYQIKFLYSSLRFPNAYVSISASVGVERGDSLTRLDQNEGLAFTALPDLTRENSAATESGADA